MPRIANLMPQRTSVWVGVPSGTSKANKALHQSALHSILGFYYGTSESLATSYSPPMLDIQRIVRDTIGDTLTEIYNLLTWDTGWNSYDACAPAYDAVMYADNWIVQMFLAVKALGNRTASFFLRNFVLSVAHVNLPCNKLPRIQYPLRVPPLFQPAHDI